MGKVVNFILYKVIDTLSSNFRAEETFEDYSRCFNKLDDIDVENDIIEIRHGSDGTISHSQSDGVSIHVSVIDEGTRTNLLFGRKHNLNSITIDSPYVWSGATHEGGDGNFCLDARESAASIKIQNGVTIESQCITA